MIEINNILSTMIWLPILGGLSLLLIGDAEEKRKDLMRMVAIAVSIITFLLSIFFFLSQFLGFQELINKGYYFTGAQSTVTTSFLYVLALLHLVHVFAGVIVLIVVFVNNKNKKYNDETLGFELAETFWHFLGFLWLYLFVFLYFFR